MTEQEMRDTIRQMLKDWNTATPAQRAEALKRIVPPYAVRKRLREATLSVGRDRHTPCR